jgi:hypothetical protein
MLVSCWKALADANSRYDKLWVLPSQVGKKVSLQISDLGRSAIKVRVKEFRR